MSILISLWSVDINYTMASRTAAQHVDKNTYRYTHKTNAVTKVMYCFSTQLKIITLLRMQNIGKILQKTNFEHLNTMLFFTDKAHVFTTEFQCEYFMYKNFFEHTAARRSIALSRFCIVSITACQWDNNSCRSTWARRKSSEVFSSSSCQTPTSHTCQHHTHAHETIILFSECFHYRQSRLILYHSAVSVSIIKTNIYCSLSFNY